MSDIRWLTRYGSEGPSSRYRAYQIAEGLKAFGYESTISPLAPWRSGQLSAARGVIRRWVELCTSPPSELRSAYVLQKEPIMPPALFKWPVTRVLGTEPLIWDVDDAVWIGRRGAAAMATRMARNATVVTAGNPLIAQWVEAQGGRAVVIPTCFEPVRQPAEMAEHSEVHVVWIGSPATAPLLERWGPALTRALSIRPDLRLRFVGGEPPRDLSSDGRVDVVPWTPENEAEALDWADLGLALQPRSEYNDHKCGFKVVQYLSVGVVPIVSEGPVHRWIVGDVGVVVSSDGDLIDALASVDRPALEPDRRTAHQRWRNEFSLDVGVRRWNELLMQLGVRTGSNGDRHEQ